jgi:SAM-dependent methyltransferase
VAEEMGRTPAQRAARAMDQPIVELIVALQRRAILPARRRMRWFDGLCHKLATLAHLTVGDEGTSMEALNRNTARQRAFMTQQLEMASGIPPGLLESLLSSEDATLTSSRLCDVREFRMPEIRQRLADLGFDQDAIHRRHWERAAVAFLVEEFGYFDSHSVGLGIGVAREDLLYLFSNHCGQVTGIDLYLPRFRNGAGIRCEDVYASAPFPYRSERLRVVAMDMRELRFSDATFDFVWSVSSVEHLGSIPDILATFLEIERVLKPGGHAFITTEWNRLWQNPAYEPGSICFDPSLYGYLISKLSDLRPLTALCTEQTYHEDHFFAQRRITGSGAPALPYVNVFWSGTFTTPVLLILQKDHTPLEAKG